MKFWTLVVMGKKGRNKKEIISPKLVQYPGLRPRARAGRRLACKRSSLGGPRIERLSDD